LNEASILLLYSKRALQLAVAVGGLVPIGAVSPACIYKWLRRHKAQGMVGLHGRSSRPHRWRAQTLEAGEARIEALRRGRQPCS
jgi:hypothetical protein